MKVEEGVVYLYWVSKLINSNIIIKRKKNKKIKKKGDVKDEGGVDWGGVLN